MLRWADCLFKCEHCLLKPRFLMCIVNCPLWPPAYLLTSHPMCQEFSKALRQIRTTTATETRLACGFSRNTSWHHELKCTKMSYWGTRCASQIGFRRSCCVSTLGYSSRLILSPGKWQAQLTVRYLSLATTRRFRDALSTWPIQAIVIRPVGSLYLSTYSLIADS